MLSLYIRPPTTNTILEAIELTNHYPAFFQGQNVLGQKRASHRKKCNYFTFKRSLSVVVGRCLARLRVGYSPAELTPAGGAVSPPGGACKRLGQHLSHAHAHPALRTPQLSTGPETAASAPRAHSCLAPLPGGSWRDPLAPSGPSEAECAAACTARAARACAHPVPPPAARPPTCPRSCEGRLSRRPLPFPLLLPPPRLLCHSSRLLLRVTLCVAGTGFTPRRPPCRVVARGAPPPRCPSPRIRQAACGGTGAPL